MPLKKITDGLIMSFGGALGGIMGALGGSGYKPLRRYGIPTLITIIAAFYLHSWYVLFLMALCAPLSLGYGIPMYLFDFCLDEGAALARFYYKLTKRNHRATDMLTRGTIGAMIGAICVVIPLLKGNWLVYSCGVLAIVLIQSFLSYRDMGVISIPGKQIAMSEYITWGLITSAIIIMIKY